MTWTEEMAVRTLWQEARSETLDGQRAVAHVLWNRLRSGRWGRTFAEVVLWPEQFSGWNPHDSNRLAVAKVVDGDPTLGVLEVILQEAAAEPDLTNGATHYFAPRAVRGTPIWVPGAIFCGVFGTQRFYRGVK